MLRQDCRTWMGQNWQSIRIYPENTSHPRAQLPGCSNLFPRCYQHSHSPITPRPTFVFYTPKSSKRGLSEPPPLFHALPSFPSSPISHAQEEITALEITETHNSLHSRRSETQTVPIYTPNLSIRHESFTSIPQ